MKISAKIDYACRALLELSVHWPHQEPLSVNLIAEQQKIPIKFLMQILLSLKQMGYTQSSRGKYGGYRLQKAPKEIILGDIVRAFGQFDLINDSSKDSAHEGVMTAIWQDIENSIFEKMDKIDFEDVANRHRQNANVMMYEI